jgi:hypothetical protein
MAQGPETGTTGLVGGALGKIDFPAPATSEALADIAHRLETEYPRKDPYPLTVTGAGCRLASSDSLWDVWLTSNSIMLETKVIQTSEEFIARLERLAAPIEAVLEPQTYNRVELRYLQAGPIVDSPPHDFLASAGVPWEQAEELTQTVKGPLPHGRFILRYGVQPGADEAFYMADASVFTEFVPHRELSIVLHELGHENLSLLSGVATPEIRPISVEEMIQIPRLSLWEMIQWSGGHGQPVFGVIGWNSGYQTWDPVGRINEDRLRLLARKSSGLPFSRDDETRLKELTDRVRRLLPRVSDRDFEELAAVDSRTDDLANTVRQIRDQYHLDDSQ